MLAKFFTLILLLLSSAAMAERPSTGKSMTYIVGMSQSGFDSTGTILIPITIMEDTFEGQLDPVTLLLYGQHLVNDCVENVLRKTPPRRSSYVADKAAFDQGLCEINKCYQSATLLAQLAFFGELSTTDEQAQAKLFAQVQKTYSSSCAGRSPSPPRTSTPSRAR